MRRALIPAFSLLTATALAFGVGGARAASESPRVGDNHCITPLGDVNELYGISAQIVNPFCTRVDAGESWVPTGGPPWFVNTSFAAVPAGFVPAAPTPLEDFLAKFVAVKYVVDAGTLQERTYTFPASDKLWIGESPFGPGFPAVHPITLGTLRPVSVGDHTVRVYWVMSAMHCDGLGTDVTVNCLPAGEVPYFSAVTSFEVAPGAALAASQG